VRRRRSVLVTVLAALLLIGFLFVFVYPTRTYVTQREQIQASQQRLDVLERETATLERETRRLDGDAEIERVAREQYGLVRPGEIPYVLVPEPTPETTPQTTPATNPTAAPDRKQPAGK
jgi:cell division protein FtsB